MANERDKFLTEAMGEEPWERGNIGLGQYTVYIDFSTWGGFGKLWVWAGDQEWFEEFWLSREWSIPHTTIHPEVFANAVCKWLSER